MKYFKEIAIYIGLPLIFLAIMAFKNINHRNMITSIQQDSQDKGFAVVELFTSEGCWSCPPADELIARLQKGNNNQQLYIMAFHVDYWDHQGWKDRFSQADFTERQKQYAAWLRLGNIYTPQLVVNGKTEMVGSDEGAVLGAISAALRGATAPPLTLKAEQGNGTLTITYAGAVPHKKARLLTALVQKTARSEVNAGENAGKQLSHVQIVRQLQQQELKEQGTVTLKLPAGFRAGDWEVITFVQQKNTGEITQAAKLTW
ncbi:DUF1223 domain-containing protein [Chitinophaga oryzae]|uniref:DUF1223 domain-containing protein n=1 Tax=Chitinophaga oryzae TaxID=2725414 RepID=A0AAE7D6G7_9BACT|nr:DUF1223 domain-containing protein [Chitinophaga oryzae]QJB30672.1 DUF1223 domain-containing protein [Chitinophaga oryzae]QJB37173.1 DUF1223 domain-containing protein [Chitinophaga oryzae]